MSDTDNTAQGSFWSTVPGILTGIAAVITAIGGLVAALYAAGVISGSTPQQDQIQPAAQTTNTPGTNPGAGMQGSEVQQQTPPASNGTAPSLRHNVTGTWAPASGINVAFYRFTQNEARLTVTVVDEYGTMMVAGTGEITGDIVDVDLLADDGQGTLTAKVSANGNSMSGYIQEESTGASIPIQLVRE